MTYWLLLLGISWSTCALAAPLATRIDGANAAALLFGGSDPIGGVGDWYISNGVIEAIIDDVGPQDDLLPLLGPSTPPKQSFAASSGGMLVDLALVGRDNDQFSQLFTVAGLGTANRVFYRSAAVNMTGDTATITVTGGVNGFDTGATPVPAEALEAVTAYSLTGDEPFLLITTTITNRHPTNPAAGLAAMLDPIIWTQRGPLPFSPLPERGFRHGILDLANPLIALEQPIFAAAPGNLGPADGVLDPATGAGTGEVAYGLLPIEIRVDPDGDGPTPPAVTQIRQLFGVTNNTTTALGSLAPGGAVPPSGVLRYTRRLYVGGRNDVASVSNLMLPALGARFGFATGTMSGDVDGTDSAAVAATIIAIRTGGGATPLTDGAPVTQVRTAADGTFAGVVLPVGTYRLTVRAPERPELTVEDISITADNDTRVTIPPLAGVGTLHLRVVEARRGRNRPLPARVIVRGIGGSADPVLNRHFDASLIDPTGGPDTDLHPETFAGGPGQGNTILVGREGTSVELRPGRYELLATHGPEYSVQRQRVTIKAGRTLRVRSTLQQVVATPDALSVDFHVHSARSFDASAPLRDRVLSFAAEGVEVMVSTDHDLHVDYAPVIKALELGDVIGSIVGNEVTTAVENPPSFPGSIGHLNAWPVRVDATARRRGAIEDEFVAPNVILHRLRSAGAQVVQVNHPRAELSGVTSLGLFTNIAFDPDQPLTAAPNSILLDRDVLGPGRTGTLNPGGWRNLDFDTMEIANGLDVATYVAVRRDWLALLNQTDRRTVPFIAGTAVSDSHRLTLETPGYFRTYVLNMNDAPGSLDEPQFDTAVKAGAMVGTNGPILTVEATSGSSTGGPGAVLTTTDGNVNLVISVEAAPYIPVEEVRVIANGFVIERFDATTSPAVRPAPRNPFSRSRKRIRRFSARLPITAAVDTYVIVEAGARLEPLSTTPEPLSRLVPGIVPLAFSNPIFIDRGGDGITPPGLPVMATVGGEARSAAAQRSRQALVPTGPQQHAQLLRDLDRPTADYFPLARITLPAPATP